MRTINMDSWERKQHYQFFKSMDYPQYNICCNIDITNFLQVVKKEKLSFYYAMIYAATITLNEVEQFCYRMREDQVVVHDRIHPSFTELIEGSELFKMVTVNMEPTMQEFLPKAKEKSKNQKSYFPTSEDVGRDDLIYITCIPWISFTHISHTIKLNAQDSVPRISWGKYFEENGRYLLPFSVQVNHALVDGVHVGKYVNKLQEYLDTFYLS